MTLSKRLSQEKADARAKTHAEQERAVAESETAVRKVDPATFIRLRHALLQQQRMERNELDQQLDKGAMSELEDVRKMASDRTRGVMIASAEKVLSI